MGQHTVASSRSATRNVDCCSRLANFSSSELRCAASSSFSLRSWVTSCGAAARGAGGREGGRLCWTGPWVSYRPPPPRPCTPSALHPVPSPGLSVTAGHGGGRGGGAGH